MPLTRPRPAYPASRPPALPYTGAGVLPGGRHVRSGIPGQDYALAGGTPLASWGVVCDGCSGGGPDVGLGAGALARISAKRLAAPDALEFLSQETSLVSAQLARDLEPWRDLLGWENLLATAVMARRDRNRLTFRVFGDGGFSLFHDDGSLSIYWGTYTTNAPNYIGLRLSPAGRPPASAQDAFWLHRFASPDQQKMELVSVSQPDPVFHFDTESDGICGFALMSDGADTLAGKTVLNAIMDTVSIRREGMPLATALGACSEIWRHAGTYPVDDLAMVLSHWR